MRPAAGNTPHMKVWVVEEHHRCPELDCWLPWRYHATAKQAEAHVERAARDLGYAKPMRTTGGWYVALPPNDPYGNGRVIQARPIEIYED